MDSVQSDTPSQQIVRAARPTATVTDSLGRSIVVRKLGVMDRMVMSKAAGDAATNQAYMLYALVACSVVSIDGTPSIAPQNQRQLEAGINTLGDEGYDAALEAVAGFYADQGEATLEAAKK